MNRIYRFIRDVTVEECGWLSRDYKSGEEVYEFTGVTYGCISPAGVAVSEFDGENPFYEIPLDAIVEI